MWITDKEGLQHEMRPLTHNYTCNGRILLFKKGPLVKNNGFSGRYLETKSGRFAPNSAIMTILFSDGSHNDDAITWNVATNLPMKPSYNVGGITVGETR